jgi:hypothetical protein
MKPVQQLLIVVLFGILISGMMLPSKTSADQGSCYLKAIRTDVYVVVYDLDQEGNTGYQIWNGKIDEGQEVLINAPNGQFRYYTNAEPADDNEPLSGGISRLCSDKRRIGVP